MSDSKNSFKEQDVKPVFTTSFSLNVYDPCRRCPLLQTWSTIYVLVLRSACIIF